MGNPILNLELDLRHPKKTDLEISKARNTIAQKWPYLLILGVFAEVNYILADIPSFSC